jgi:hypothetical protein
MTQLERQILELAQWLEVVFTNLQDEETYLAFSSVTKEAIKILKKYDLKSAPRLTTKKNIIHRYVYLANHFRLDSMRDKYFTINEIIVKNNMWYVPEIDKLG